VARWRSAPCLVRRRASMTSNDNLVINPSVMWLNKDNIFALFGFAISDTSFQEQYPLAKVIRSSSWVVMASD